MRFQDVAGQRAPPPSAPGGGPDGRAASRQQTSLLGAGHAQSAHRHRQRFRSLAPQLQSRISTSLTDVTRPSSTTAPRSGSPKTRLSASGFSANDPRVMVIPASGRISISQGRKSQSMAQSEAIAAPSDAPNGTIPRQRAVLFIVFLGIVSLFGDMTYEGARSITGPYLGVLGVSAPPIGIVAGFG